MDSDLYLVNDLFSFLIVVRCVHLKHNVDDEECITDLINEKESYAVVQDFLKLDEAQL